MDALLAKIESPRDLQELSAAELEQLAAEMREVLCNLVSSRTAHFRLEPGRRRAVPRPAHHVRFQPRPPDLGHRPSDLSAQADHRPLPRIRHASAPRAA